MKKLLIVTLLFVSGIASAACQGPYCYDDKGAYITDAPLILTRTLAQMNLIQPRDVGQLLVVSDGAQSRLCVSSGTAAGAFVVAVATGVFTAASYPHCQ